MNMLITICARGGSKGIPGKNIKPLCGKPLIGYTIDVAKRFAAETGNTAIALSTDSDEIIHVAAECGLQSDYKRSDYLAMIPVARLMPSRISCFIQKRTKELPSIIYWTWM